MSAAPAPPPEPLTPEACAAALNVSRETLERLEAYVALLRRWQRRRNLIGRGTEADIWRRHILDSGQLAAHLPAGARRIVDLGSGAGLPGLVLAILTGAETTLVEADAVKAAFLAEAARLTEAPCEIRRARIEDLAPWPVDALTARALAPLPRLLDYAAPFAPPLSIFPKGARWREELTEASRTWHISARDAPSATEPAARILIVERFARKAAMTGDA
ncbi:MAG: 16S rRNA (guanine(527)-N(7))-methyltransferase RsmG [Defluviicoccus sp.]|nr:16S rRNA (guanine(527)-N(7))-methyltransferase RsmG [Defluviicoccus sp.]MDE0384179.1 16S rRNA (guanine(527)-N(7))-methyltransferase RsmG [Defluviicoccus sp.]